MRYDLIYAQSGYVYTVILDLPHPGGANAPGASHGAEGIIEDISHPSQYTHQSYGYLQGGTSSSNSYASPTSNVYLGKSTSYEFTHPH